MSNYGGALMSPGHADALADSLQHIGPPQSISAPSNAAPASALVASAGIPFTVVFCSSYDEGYPPTELENRGPHTKGWQSARFCEYPQELVLQLERQAQIKQIQILSHQSKIATKIEISVGAPAVDDMGVMSADYSRAKFKRLGYLSLESNERSNLKLRELKSVYVDAKGQFLKLVIRKCHLNHANLFNQVSLIAVNILGSRVEDAPLDDLSVNMELDEKTALQIRQLNAAKKQAILVEDYDEAKRLKLMIDSLRQVGTLISELERKKSAAVKREDFDAAKAYRDEIDRLRSGSSSSGEREREDEDRDRRRTRPKQLPPREPEMMVDDGYSPPEHPLVSSRSGQNGSNFAVPSAAKVSEPLPRSASIEPEVVVAAPYRNDRDERPLPAMKAKPADNPFSDVVEDAPQPLAEPARKPRAKPPPRKPAAAAPPPVASSAGPASPRTDASGLPAPEELSAAVMKDAEPLLPILGEHTVKCLFSKNWAHREAALGTVQNGLQTEAYSQSKHDVFVAVCRVLKLALTDRVAKVFLVGAALMETMLETFADPANAAAPSPSQKGSAQGGPINPISRSELRRNLERHVVALIDNLSDSNLRIKSTSLSTLLLIAQNPHVGPGIIVEAALKPLGKKEEGKPAPLRGRAELFIELLQRFKISEVDGLTVPTIMRFVIPFLPHRDGAVRAAGMQLTTVLYGLVGPKKLLPFLKNQRQGIKDALEVSFMQAGLLAPDSHPLAGDTSGGADMIASPGPPAHSNVPTGRGDKGTIPGKGQHQAAAPKGKPPAAGRGAPAASTNKGKPAAGSKATNHPPPAGAAPKSSADTSAHAPSHQPHHPQNAKAAHSPAHNGPERGFNNTNQAQPDDADALAHPDDPQADDGELEEGFCQFCGLEDPTLTEEKLDLHYWQACPMLTSCKLCEQVIEIPTLNEHLLVECEVSGQHKECPRCREAIAVNTFDEHVKKQSCKPCAPGSDANRCPLCHNDIPPGLDGWKTHLLTKGCPNNDRKPLQGS